MGHLRLDQENLPYDYADILVQLNSEIRLVSSSHSSSSNYYEPPQRVLRGRFQPRSSTLLLKPFTCRIVSIVVPAFRHTSQDPKYDIGKTKKRSTTEASVSPSSVIMKKRNNNRNNKDPIR